MANNDTLTTVEDEQIKSLGDRDASEPAMALSHPPFFPHPRQVVGGVRPIRVRIVAWTSMTTSHCAQSTAVALAFTSRPA